MSSRSACAFTASRNRSDTRPSTTGDGTGIPNWKRMNIDSPALVARFDVAVEVETIQALHFQRDVPIKQFRDGRHSRILTKRLGPLLVGLRSKTSLERE